MKTNDINDAISYWTNWANTSSDKCYDYALLKIWIKFERYVGEIFVSYATGGKSESGYSPQLKLQFNNEEHLNAFLRDPNKMYVDYIKQIQKLSKHIFVDDPFDSIFLDVTNLNVFNQIIAIRNYIAHESGEAKIKMIKCCFNGNEKKFKEPCTYLLTKEKTTNKTYYTFYVETIKNMAILLSSPTN